MIIWFIRVSWTGSNEPEVVHVHGNRLGTMIEDPSINWPETSMEPHFPELVSFNLENNAVIKVFIRSFVLVLKTIISGLEILFKYRKYRKLAFKMQFKYYFWSGWLKMTTRRDFGQVKLWPCSLKRILVIDFLRIMFHGYAES